MSEELSAYELKRLETIRQNALIMASLGITDAVKDLRQATAPAPKPKVVRKPKAPVVASRRRTSGRLAGEAPMEITDMLDDDEAEAMQANAYRDPNDVGQMTYAELQKWCARIREDELQRAWLEGLTAEERARVVRANDEWLGPFTEFTARFGSANEGPISKQNLKSVVQQVMKLVSGAGVRHEKKQTAFAVGQPLTLGITAAEVDHLRAAAQLWMPQTTAPADLIGTVVEGVTVTRKPTNGPPFDTSNGWLLNHPLKKVQIYCKHVDEIRETSLEATMRRLLGDDFDTWRGATSSGSSPAATTEAAATSPTSSPPGEESSSASDPPPFTMGMVEEAVDLVGGDDAEAVRSYLEVELGLPTGGLQAHEHSMLRMIAAANGGGGGGGDEEAGTATGHESPPAAKRPRK